ncbi:MAG: proton-translocating transhydrogenase family protein [Alphaproteobacteria bacterium]|nr:proton-translocating transhydrogenase family protein [Alphaproteobacteria bacterium]
MNEINTIAKEAQNLSHKAAGLSDKVSHFAQNHQDTVVNTGIDPFVFSLTIFLLACFVGYYVVWKVTPALHTPLVSVTNAISGIVIVGAILILGPEGFGVSQFLGFFAVMIASINIFGGFIVTQRMLAMFKKKK